MSEGIVAVRRLAQLLSLDEDQVVAGYLKFSPGNDAPDKDAGTAYWHGWVYAESVYVKSGQLPQAESGGKTDAYIHQ